ncbi:MAG: hypothetical protein ABI573_01430 [Chloroflexota bacterium]
MDFLKPRISGRLGAMAMAGAVALAFAACNGSTGGPYGGGGTPKPTTAGAGGSVYEVKIAHDTTIGAFLTGEDGKTLYVLTKDTPGVSSCAGNCATAWPPFGLGAGETVKGGTDVTGTFGTISRDDGTTQVMYKDAPLYYFAGDAATGEVNGQGLNGVWYVASPDGGPNSGSGSASPAATPRY